MANEQYVLGIDIGTSGTKTLLVDRDGNVRAKATAEYPLSTPRPMWSEQDPEHWWQATVATIRQVIEEAAITADHISCIGLTGQMHGLVALDSRGKVLRPAILWNDQRTGDQCDAIHERIGLDDMLRITGKPALTGFTAPKILWVKEYEPHLYAQIARILLPKDYIRYRLTGAFETDVADASGTSLFDVPARRWSADIIEALDIPLAWLPEVRESPATGATVAPDNETGLRTGTPVVGGAGDQAAEAVGCGIVHDAAVSVAVGTSGVVFISTDQLRLDPAGRLHAYCHAVPGAWHLMGVMLSAGGSLRWYRDTLGTPEVERADRENIDPYDLLMREAAAAPPGCEGLFFLPYLTGERCPHPDSHARGAFIGLTLRHQRPHLIRAVVEGVTFGLMDSLVLARDLGITVDRIRISGGGARSPLWRQIMADTFGCDVATINVSEGAAFGAAVLAMVGAEMHPSVRDASESIVREVEVTTPGGMHETCAPLYERFRALYPALKDEFRRIGDLADSHR